MTEHTLQKGQLDALTLNGLCALLEEMGEAPFRAKQIFGWLHKKRAASLNEMPNIPAALRAALAERWVLGRPGLERALKSADGTVKLLAALTDGGRVETVLMRYRHGTSVCVSSQAGCRMGCRFCASSVPAPGFTPGLVRGLTAAEMAGQVYLAEDYLRENGAAAPAGGRVSHAVLMGIGEPLDNFDAVMDFISIITAAEGQNLPGRGLSLSTCGLTPAIEELAKRNLQLTLSVSLHAANDETRARLMPVNRRWPLAGLMAACRAYRRATGRRLSYEYALFAGVNDSPRDAAALAALLAGQDAHVNLLYANPVAGSPFRPSPPKTVRGFAAALAEAGLTATLRRRLGADIDAACGQLRRSAAQGAPPAGRC